MVVQVGPASSESSHSDRTYVIENVDRRNDILLADDSSGTLVAGSSEADADPPLNARWNVARLRNGRYTMSPAAQRNKYASCPTGISLGSAVVTSPTSNDWVVKETRVKETFVISHVQHQLYWGIDDDAQGTRVRLRHPPSAAGNQWKFRPCLGSTPQVQQSLTGSLTRDESKVDCQTTSGPSYAAIMDSSRPHILEGHTDTVTKVTYSPDGKHIVSCSWDCTIRVWDVRTMRLALKPIEGHSDRVHSVALSPDGKRIVSGSRDRTARIWDMQSGTLLRTMIGHDDGVVSVACSPDGKRIVSGSDDKTIRVWDMETGHLVLGPLLNHRKGVSAVDFSPDGKKVLSGSIDCLISVYDAETGHVIGGRYFTSEVFSAIFYPDSKWIVCGVGKGDLRIWDMRSCESNKLDWRHKHTNGAYSVGMSPDGKRVVSGGGGIAIVVWDAESGCALGRLRGHYDSVHSVGFSPDGRWIVSGSADKTVRIWDAAKLEAMPDVDERLCCMIC